MSAYLSSACQSLAERLCLYVRGLPESGVVHGIPPDHNRYHITIGKSIVSSDIVFQSDKLMF